MFQQIRDFRERDGRDNARSVKSGQDPCKNKPPQYSGGYRRVLISAYGK